MKLDLSPDLKIAAAGFATQTLIVYGGKGMGKTNLASVLAEEMFAARIRFSIIDPLGVWWGLQYGADRKSPGLGVLILGGRRGDMPIEPTAGAVVADLVVDEDVSVIIDISCRASGQSWGQGEKIRFVRDYTRRLYERQGERRRPIMQIIDEAGRFVPQEIRKGQEFVAECLGAIEVLVEEGRNAGIGVCLITQRSARMNKSVSELADCMIAFRTVGPRSIGAVLDWLGEHVEKERHREIVGQLRELALGTALVVSPGWLHFEGIVPIRMRRTFDSSATPTGGREHRPAGKAAKPDLAKYQERMAATIEQAKANDPAELRRQITLLKKEVGAASSAKGDSAALREVERERDALRRELAAATTRFEALQRAMPPEIDWRALRLKVNGGICEVIEAGRRQTQALLSHLDSIEKAQHRARTIKAPPAPRPVPASQAPAPPRAPRAAAAPADASGVGSGERLLLRVLRAGGAMTQEKLMVAAVYSSAGTTRTYLGKLSGAGLIQRGNGGIEITDAGRALISGEADPDLSLNALVRAWEQKLDVGPAKLLRILVNVSPDGLSPDDLQARAGYASAGTFRTYIGKLVGKHLAVRHRGQILAGEALFAWS